MLHLYDALVGLAVWLLLVPLELAAAALGRSSLGRLAGRLGRPPHLRERGRRLVVLHAVSVGEMAAAGALARHWAERHPGDRLVLTAGHRDGLAAGERLVAELPAAVAVAPLPWDRARALRRWLRALAPDLLVVVETEIWPRLYLACRELGIPLALASARVYPRDVGRYRWLPTFFRTVLAAADWVGAQSEIERERWIAIGARPERVEVTGNLKYDAIAPAPSSAPRKPDGAVWIVAASTHPGEERQLFRALAGLPAGVGAPQLVLAPRHPRRARALVRAARRAGFTAATLTEVERGAAVGHDAPRVVVVDRFGWLPAAIATADLVVLGGTLVQRGGHNPLEAARAGRALVVGPHVQNFADVIGHLRTRGGLVALDSPEGLAPALASLLRDPEQRRRLGERAAAAVAEGSCVERHADRLESLLALRQREPRG